MAGLSKPVRFVGAFFAAAATTLLAACGGSTESHVDNSISSSCQYSGSVRGCVDIVQQNGHIEASATMHKGGKSSMNMAVDSVVLRDAQGNVMAQSPGNGEHTVHNIEVGATGSCPPAGQVVTAEMHGRYKPWLSSDWTPVTAKSVAISDGHCQTGRDFGTNNMSVDGGIGL